MFCTPTLCHNSLKEDRCWDAEPCPGRGCTVPIPGNPCRSVHCARTGGAVVVQWCGVGVVQGHVSPLWCALLPRSRGTLRCRVTRRAAISLVSPCSSAASVVTCVRSLYRRRGGAMSLRCGSHRFNLTGPVYLCKSPSQLIPCRPSPSQFSPSALP